MKMQMKKSIVAGHYLTPIPECEEFSKNDSIRLSCCTNVEFKRKIKTAQSPSMIGKSGMSLGLEDVIESANGKKSSDESENTQEARTMCTKAGPINTSLTPMVSKYELDIYDDEESSYDDVLDLN